MAKSKPKSSNGQSKGPSWEETVGGLEGSWKKNRTAKRQGNDQPEIPNGKYLARVMSMTAGVYAAKPADKAAGRAAQPATPYVKTRFVIADGEHAGEQPYRNDTLVGADADQTRMKQEMFATQLIQGLNYETDDLDLKSDIPEIVAEVNKEKPYVEIYANNKVGKDSVSRLNISVNRVLDDDEIEGLSAGGEDDEEEESEEEEEEIVDQDEDEDTEEESDEEESEEEDETEEEGEEEEEEEKPAPRKKPAGKAPAKKAPVKKKPALK